MSVSRCSVLSDTFYQIISTDEPSFTGSDIFIIILMLNSTLTFTLWLSVYTLATVQFYLYSHIQY